MRFSFLVFWILLLIAIIVNTISAQDIPPGPYFGQEPPGDIPRIFAEGIISKKENYEGAGTFSPDGKEFAYTILEEGETWEKMIIHQVYLRRDENGKWNEADIYKIIRNKRAFGVQFSPNGRILSFQVPESEETERNTDIWICERDGEKWSEPSRLPYPINTEWREAGHQFTNDETLYFITNNRSGVKAYGEIYRSKLVNGKYSSVERLPFCTNYDEECLFIAPDESYIIFCSWRPTGYGMHDLYISFHEKNNIWTSPQILGTNINTKANETRPVVTPDRRYMLFSRGFEDKADFYWVDAGFIDDFKNKVKRSEK